MELELTLHLPRDELTVPVSRHVCRTALAELGATEDVAMRRFAVAAPPVSCRSRRLCVQARDESGRDHLQLPVLGLDDVGAGGDQLVRRDLEM